MTAHADLQQRISEWADLTFGRAQVLPSLRRVQSELLELESAIQPGEAIAPAAEEAADVLICLFRLASVVGFDLLAEAERKHAINLGRHWKLNGDGTGQHVKELTR